MTYSDLIECKALLEIPSGNTAEDAKLGLLIELASRWIDEILGRTQFMEKLSRTEYYDGTGSQKLLLRARPVYTSPTIQVFVDRGGYYGTVSGAFAADTTELTWGEDFALDIDQDDGTSRSGILVRLHDYWPLPSARQVGLLSPFLTQSFGNVKVVYTGGYTIDTLPSPIRHACALLVARLRYVWPLGIELGSESYEERSISVVTSQRDKLLALVRPMLLQYRNWAW